MASRAAGALHDVVFSGYGWLPPTLIDAERFPALTAAIDAGVFAEPDEPDDEFVFGLERVLDGIGVLVAERRSAAGLLR